MRAKACFPKIFSESVRMKNTCKKIKGLSTSAEGLFFVVAGSLRGKNDRFWAVAASLRHKNVRLLTNAAPFRAKTHVY